MENEANPDLSSPYSRLDMLAWASHVAASAVYRDSPYPELRRTMWVVEVI